jgi:3-phosphoglycerate kinase
MKKTLSLKDLSLDQKKVLVRVDFNVPLSSDGKITDNSRIKAALPTIEHLLSKGCKVILMSHLGRPKKGSKELSLKPIAEELGKLLKIPVKMAPDCIGEQVKQMADQLKSGEVLLLENLRFHKAEEAPEKNPEFAKQLASLADYYIDDAFGCAHRAHASIVDVPKLFGKRAAPGFLLEKEIEFLGHALKHPKRPFLALIGGAKISSKIGVLKALAGHVDCLAIGGGMAFTFLKAQGLNIGKSLVEDSFIDQAKEIIEVCKKRNIPLLLPTDAVIAEKMEDKEPQVIPLIKGIPSEFMALDIGPATVKLFSEAILGAKTILWNGPMGVFENPLFAKGTEEIARIFAKAKAITIAGGGETVAALAKVPGKEQISHVSTGGGATLEYVELGSLPGIDVLRYM